MKEAEMILIVPAGSREKNLQGSDPAEDHKPVLIAP